VTGAHGQTVIGIDGGNSKTHVLVADAGGCILGFARAEGSNHERIGFVAAEQVLRSAVTCALDDAAVQAPVDGAFWALAGADTASDFERLAEIVRRIGVAERDTVENDLSAALGAGLTRGWGVGIVCGAGFSSGGIAPDGRRLKFPSLGMPTGDWGGGEEIGLEVLRLAHRAYDGRGDESQLADLVPRALGMASFAELPERMRADDLDWVVVRDGLPPLLFETASAGDAVARSLVLRIGNEGGVTAATIIRRLGLEDLDVEVVLGGSVFRSESRTLFETIEARVRETAPEARIVRPEFPPVVGALFEALRELGIPIDEHIRETVRTTLPEALRDD